MNPPAPIILPSQEDPVVESTVGGIGGPLGRWARIGASWWTPLRVLVVMATLSYALGYVLDLSCRTQGWRSPERYEHLCYTDISPLYSLRGFADGLMPYVQAMPNGQHLEYPVLTGGFMQVAAMITSAITSVATTDRRNESKQREDERDDNRSDGAQSDRGGAGIDLTRAVRV